MSEVFRKPDGTLTSDINQYGMAWKELGDRVAVKLDCEVTGYDPWIDIKRKGSSDTARLPLWLVDRILTK